MAEHERLDLAFCMTPASGIPAAGPNPPARNRAGLSSRGAICCNGNVGLNPAELPAAAYAGPGPAPGTSSVKLSCAAAYGGCRLVGGRFGHELVDLQVVDAN